MILRPSRRETRSEWGSSAIPAPGTSTFGPLTRAGEYVDPDHALRLSTVWACVNLLSNLVSGFPIGTYRSSGSSTAGTIDNLRTPLQPPPVIANPSPTVSRMLWVRQVMMSWLLRGNAWGDITAWDSQFRPTQIELLSPDDVHVYRQGSTGPLSYKTFNKDRKVYPEGDLWHAPALVMPGSPLGLSPISYAAETIGLGLGVQAFGAGWFGEGGHPSAVLQTDQVLKSESGEPEKIKRRFLEATRGRREPAVLGAGLKYVPIQVAPNESQFLESMRANVTDVARYFGVPATRIGGASGDSMTYKTAEQEGLDLLTYTVNWWVVLLEECLTNLLPRPQYVKLNVDAMLRSDAKTRNMIGLQNVQGGRWSVNDWRRNEDEPPIGPEGDTYLWPPMAIDIAKTTEGEPDPEGVTSGT